MESSMNHGTTLSIRRSLRSSATCRRIPGGAAGVEPAGSLDSLEDRACGDAPESILSYSVVVRSEHQRPFLERPEMSTEGYPVAQADKGTRAAKLQVETVYSN